MRFHYRLGWLCTLAFARLIWGFRRRGIESIPKGGPVIIASNHISNWDPILVGLGCRREVHFWAKEELFHNPWLAFLIRAYNAIPVRRGKADRKALRDASEVLARGGVLVMFPGGTRDESGEVKDPKPGVGFIACANNAPVVPAYITGSNRLARATRRACRLMVAFGEPIAPREARSGEEYRAFASQVAGAIGRLRQEVEGL
ncbi:MAG: 1-acyl-sn-glycerol-3-phosphate acyltransferase [Candidatus Eisenbacteria bacterium]|nr:1-acyl-sn-glycerol-3-phosphate acyltransferase [Candidatus Eisenbacteria bacterium]